MAVKNLSIFLFFSCCLSLQSLAQSVSSLMGARPNGIGYATSTLFDPWGLFNNVAGISEVAATTTAFAYDLHPSLTGANRMAAIALIPLKTGVTGVGAFRFGDDLYNEHILSAGYSNQFGIASLGVKVNYIQYRTEGFGSQGVFTVSFGGIAKLTPMLAVGAHLTNINQPSVTDQEKLPTKLTAGIGITPTEKVLMVTEIEKDLDYDATWKMGLEYKFHEKFAARTGYNINPNTAFFGLGFKTNKLRIDYAIQHNVLLSISHQASVAYQVNKR
jgi:hypothetical protein